LEGAGDEVLEKAYGSLAGLAIGDAMGMPSTMYTPEQVRQLFGVIKDFTDAPGDHPIHAGLKAGQVTDDTELALLVAQIIIKYRSVTPSIVARELVEWVKRRNLLEDTRYFGPSTRRAIEALIKGVEPHESGKHGTTNGSTTRIVPVAIAYHNLSLHELIKYVEAVCLPTHGTRVAIAASTAVANVIKHGLKGLKALEEIVYYAVEGAKMVYELHVGNEVAAPRVDKRIEWAIRVVRDSRRNSVEEMALELYETIGFGVEAYEAVPAAIGTLYAAKGDPLEAIMAVSNTGGDADTIAALVGAMGGAIRGVRAFPEKYVKTIEEVNNLKLEDLAKKLVDVSHGRA